jgi:long-chain acyl-CoA synthetase
MKKPTRLFDLMRFQADNKPLNDALATKLNGIWKKFSSQEVLDKAEDAASGLYRLGVRPGDKVAIISMNRPEWNFLDLGIQMLGAASVPIYPTAPAEDYKFILNHAEVKLVFCGTKAIFDKLKTVSQDVKQLKEIYTFDQVSGVQNWEVILKNIEGIKNPEISRLREQVKGDDLASIIYTSGTTGTPKGVQLSHNNILSNVLGVHEVIPTHAFRRALSFLPLCHVFERTVNYFYQFSSVAIYYAESIDTISENLKEIKPDVFVSVPRLLEKIYVKITTKGAELTGLKRKLFDWSISLGLKYEADKSQSLGMKLQIAIARKLVFSKWQEALGGNVKLIVSGGSALQPRLARIFGAAGLQVIEGYGLTETSPVITCNRPNDFRIGTVGLALPGVQVKIADEEGYPSGEGEILAKGANVMVSYFKNPEATKEIIDQDGWLHTGDIGKMIEGRFLKITDRKKEMFKTSGGKYVAPLAIEGKFKESPFIDNIMVTGENQKFPSAIILPDFPALKDWAKKNGIEQLDKKSLVANAKVNQLISDEIQRLNKTFGQWEQVKKFRLIDEEWTTEGGELTPKLSLKRRVLTAKYKEIIEGLYK